MYTAIVIGATGLVGSALTDQLLKDDRFTTVKVFVRRTTGKTNPKLQEIITDFDNLSAVSDQITGDVLFSTLGTTLAVAGSKEAQYKIDYTYQYEFARIAAHNIVSTYVLVSSAGASSKSGVFYSRMKGELEDAVKQLPFLKVRILQPSFLDGDRSEKRTMERVGISVAKALSWLPVIGKYRPIKDETVAKAMINAAMDGTSGHITYALDTIFKVAEF